MLIGSIKEISAVDYPGKIACSIFVVGSNFRFPFSTIPQFILPEEFKHHLLVPEKEVLKFLKENKRHLEGVCLKGGEPTLYRDLGEFCEKLKELGYQVKIDTNGSNPLMLKALIIKGVVDYISLELNSPRENFEKTIGFKDSPHHYLLHKIEESIKLLKRGDVEYEFKTVLVPGITKKEDVLKIVSWIKPAKRYVLQNFDLGESAPSSFRSRPSSSSREFLFFLKELASPFFDYVEVRG
jgi:pyruvate formate lyase activating enzyme